MLSILTRKIWKYLTQLKKSLNPFLRIFLYFNKNNSDRDKCVAHFSRKRNREITYRNASTVKLK